MPTVIAGYGAQDKVPGAFGEVLYGTSGQSAASAPKLCLLVGLKKAAGNLTADTEVRQVFSKADVDVAAGAGSELALMGYSAIDVAPNVPIFLASPAAAGGAVPAAGYIIVSGSWTNVGQTTIRIDGKSIPVTIGSADTPTTTATNIANAINGAFQGRLPILASAATGTVTLTWITAGIRGNQAIVFIDNTSAPSGFAATVTGSGWIAATVYPLGSLVVPTVANGFYYKATAIAGTGTSAPVTQPTWPTTIGTTVVDNAGANQITWTCWGAIVTGGGVTLGGGAGTETYTNLLSTLLNAQFDRIGIAANDASSIAAWKTQLDNQAAAPTNILQHGVACQVSTLTNASTLAQTTLNDQRFQVLWCLNGEGFPAETAARVTALRAATEASDPDAAYNNTTIPGAPPMSQKADWPSHSQLVAALNAGVTPLTSNGDGTLKIVRSITSHSLIGSAPDYSTLDTGQASVPDFVLLDLRLYWTSVVAPANPRVQDEPPAGQRQPPSGVITPSKWASAIQGKLVDYSNGIISGTGTSPTVAPIVQAPIASDIQANFDATAKRIMVAVNVKPAFNNAAVGISVRQAA